MDDNGVGGLQFPWIRRLQDLMVVSCSVSPMGSQLAPWL
jgi:hypothetical protein